MRPRAARSRRCSVRSRLAVAAALAATIAGSAPAHAAAPPFLSRDRSPADMRSTYGSGHFGSWGIDRFGLPFYTYRVDEQHNPKARQPELAGGTQAQHQVGNDHLMADAFNDGYVQLWSQDRLSQWSNLWQPQNQHWSGGYGYLNVGGKVASTLYLDRPQGAAFERDFGVGYYTKKLSTQGMDVKETTYSPFGDDPLLVDDVT